MRKNIKKIIAVILSVISILSLASFQTFAAETDVPFESYSHWEGTAGRKAVYSTPIVEVDTVIDSRSLGLSEQLHGVTDLYCTDDGTSYIMCGEQARIVVFDKDYKYVKEITKETVGDDFTGARGVFVKDGYIYIADTEHKKVIVTDLEGNKIKDIFLPESSVIPENLNYRPRTVTIDTKGYLYVLSEECYYGAIVYDPDMNFKGFFGANTVKSTVLEAFGKVWEMLTSNNTKKSKSVKKLPYQFVDFYVDRSDFIYTVTGTTGSLRRLTNNGTNVLRKNTNAGVTDSTSYSFNEKEASGNVVQNFSSVAVTEDNLVYMLDSKCGLIYLYDNQTNLYGAFGGGIGEGNQKGVFTNAIQLATSGNKLMVLDGVLNNVTVFSTTAYGDMLIEAQSITNKGDYIKAKPLWEEILKEDRNCRMAYVGLAKAAYMEDEYQKSMDYAEFASDRSTYSQALGFINKENLTKNFTWVAIGVVLLFVLLIVGLALKKKYKVVLIKNNNLKTYFGMFAHPFSATYDLKYRNYTSWPICIISILAFYLVSALKLTMGGFLFTEYDPATYNVLFIVLKTVGLVVLWSVANWLVSQLFGGNGTFKQVISVASYGLFPLILEGIAFIILSNSFDNGMGSFLTILSTVAMVYSLLIIAVGTMTVHEFNFGEFVATAIISILGIILIIFIAFMLGILLQQFYDFIINVFMEVMYR